MSKGEINKILGDLGEISVSYELKKRGWKVLKNIGGDGFDLLISKGHKTRRLEIKSTDPECQSGKNAKYLSFGASDKQGVEADFLIFYVHGYNTYFLIPLNEKLLPLNKSRNGNTVGSIEDCCVKANSKFENFKDCWEILE